MTEDSQLLQQFTQQGSQAAFSQIVSRHLNFVYSVCRREVGDAALAEDLTQVVFLLLARKAPSLHGETSLSGWLFQTARFVSKNARRREAFRRMQEQKAQEQAVPLGQDENTLWNQIEPHFNVALAALSAKDRETVLLRFADGLSFPELSAALGTSEDAARMRLNRAVSRLRQFFAKAGVTLSVAVLAGLLADRTVQAAPAACAAAAKTAGSGATVSPQVSFHLQGAAKAMTLNKITLAVTAALGTAAVVSVPFVTQAQNPAQKPKTILASATKPVSAGKPRSAAADAAIALLDTLQLSGPFKLHYSGVTTDVRTPEIKLAELKGLERSYADNVKSGYVTQAAADEAIHQYVAYQGSRPRVSRFDVTIASDGSKLFYEKDAPEGQVIVIYDGTRTFDYDKRFKYMLVDAGLKFYEMYTYPIPGAAVPHVALLQESAETQTSHGLFVKGNVPMLNAGGVGIQYQRGEIALTNDAGKTRMTAMTGFFLNRNFPSERWEFTGGQPFQGTTIASEIRYTYYSSPEIIPEETNYQKPFQPATTTEYRLISADTVLNPNQFDPAACLSPGDQVRENTPGPPRAFPWHPGLKLD